MNAERERTTTPPSGVSLDEAAAQLGISRDAVRLRIRRGSLNATRVNGRWVVDLNGRDGDVVRTLPVANDRVRPLVEAELAQLRLERDHARELLTRVEAEQERTVKQLDTLAEEVRQAAVERAELRRLLAEAIRSLPAPSFTMTPEKTGSPPMDMETTAKPPRPWWAFWRNG